MAGIQSGGEGGFYPEQSEIQGFVETRASSKGYSFFVDFACLYEEILAK
jgi:hypothetical protein